MDNNFKSLNGLDDKTRRKLVVEAFRKKEEAYVPYSHFHVGAAVLTYEDKMVGGFNIENASYGATNCGERTAIFTALNNGAKKMKAIAIVGDAKEYTYPCGICRQVMAEFMDPDSEIILAKDHEEFKVFKLKELLPGAFTKDDLESGNKGEKDV
ncbi:MAG: cytidine deaminase [Clostridiaceae bacterium]